MRAVVQRVSESNVIVEKNIVGEIGRGLLVFLGVGEDDGNDDLEYMVEKILNLRIFEDDKGKMNLSLLDINGDILIVSQFTLYGDVRKGRRPSFSTSAHPEIAEKIYDQFVEKCREKGVKTEKGIFGENMEVGLTNQGPVTILIDSKKTF